MNDERKECPVLKKSINHCFHVHCQSLSLSLPPPTHVPHRIPSPIPHPHPLLVLHSFLPASLTPGLSVNLSSFILLSPPSSFPPSNISIRRSLDDAAGGRYFTRFPASTRGCGWPVVFDPENPSTTAFALPVAFEKKRYFETPTQPCVSRYQYRT